MCDHSNESYKRLLSYTILNFYVCEWNVKCVTIKMKPVKVYFPTLYTVPNFCVCDWILNVLAFKWKLQRPTFLYWFKLLCLRNDMLNVRPFKWKIQSPTFLYFFKLLGPCMKSKEFDHSNESSKGLLSYSFFKLVSPCLKSCFTILN